MAGENQELQQKRQKKAEDFIETQEDSLHGYMDRIDEEYLQKDMVRSINMYDVRKGKKTLHAAMKGDLSKTADAQAILQAKFAPAEQVVTTVHNAPKEQLSRKRSFKEKQNAKKFRNKLRNKTKHATIDTNDGMISFQYANACMTNVEERNPYLEGHEDAELLKTFMASYRVHKPQTDVDPDEKQHDFDNMDGILAGYLTEEKKPREGALQHMCRAVLDMTLTREMFEMPYCAVHAGEIRATLDCYQAMGKLMEQEKNREFFAGMPEYQRKMIETSIGESHNLNEAFKQRMRAISLSHKDGSLLTVGYDNKIQTALEGADQISKNLDAIFHTTYQKRQKLIVGQAHELMAQARQEAIEKRLSEDPELQGADEEDVQEIRETRDSYITRPMVRESMQDTAEAVRNELYTDKKRTWNSELKVETNYEEAVRAHAVQTYLNQENLMADTVESHLTLNWEDQAVRQYLEANRSILNKLRKKVESEARYFDKGVERSLKNRHAVLAGVAHSTQFEEKGSHKTLKQIVMDYELQEEREFLEEQREKFLEGSESDTEYDDDMVYVNGQWTYYNNYDDDDGQDLVEPENKYDYQDDEDVLKLNGET